MALPVWNAHPNCPAHLRGAIEQRIFYAPIPLPRVVISDQATGMTASLPKALPGTLLQYCDWHAVENIMKRLADRGYKKEERETLKHLIWSFVKARTQDELVEKRAEIHLKLKQSEISYLMDYWGPRETQFLCIYTCGFPNLDSHSNQRSESIHPVTTQILNKNLSMEEATRRLSETLKVKLHELDEIEASTRSKLP
jgi:Transposase, Mutator family